MSWLKETIAELLGARHACTNCGRIYTLTRARLKQGWKGVYAVCPRCAEEDEVAAK